jgi:hypothetical protein
MKLRSGCSLLVGAIVLSRWAVIAACLFAQAEPAATSQIIVAPKELPDAVLHNPDMGWVLYENYPLDQDPHGSSTLLQVPKENFDGVDSVAVMFSWQDVEKRPDEYDFSKADFAYDYWARRGKAIQLRLSSETLLWWTNRNPPSGKGIPDFVLSKLSPNEKQTRELQGVNYVVPDARNEYYRERLKKFLGAINEHFSDERPVTLIDLRGFGVWGEWHSGFKYASAEQRHDALKGIIDVWCVALPKHQLALSYSYDPDSPKTLYEGTTEKFDERSTSHYAEYLLLLRVRLRPDETECHLPTRRLRRGRSFQRAETQRRSIPPRARSFVLGVHRRLHSIEGCWPQMARMENQRCVEPAPELHEPPRLARWRFTIVR